MELSHSQEIMETTQNEQGLATYNELKATLCGKCVDLVDFEKRVEDAKSLSRSAKDDAKNMCGYKEGKFLGIPYKKGNEKEIIEGTQAVVKGLANAQEASTEALGLSFEFEKELAKFEEFLFGLGCYNVAQNESLIDDLESAVKEGRIDRHILSEQVKARIIAVANRLKDQQNILLRLQTIESDLAKSLSEHKESVDAQCQDLSDKLQALANDLKEETSARESAIEQAGFTFRGEIGKHVEATQSALSEYKNSVDAQCHDISDKLQVAVNALKEETATRESAIEQVGLTLRGEIKNQAKISQEAIISESNARSIETNDIKEKLMLHESNTSSSFDSVRGQMKGIIQDASDTKEKVDSSKERISMIERRNGQFFNTLAYKMSIGIIAITSLVISILSILGIL